jgi:hypothetical protein
MKQLKVKIFSLISLLILISIFPLFLENFKFLQFDDDRTQPNLSNSVDSWTKRWNTIDWISDMTLDSLNNIYVLGGYPNVLLKLDQTGVILWESLLDSSASHYHLLERNSDNDLLLVGNFEFGQKEYIILSKYDDTGKQIWNKTWGGYDWLFLHDIHIDLNGNIYLVGSIEVNQSKSLDMHFLKIDDAGTILWNHTWGGENIDEYHVVASYIYNNIYVAGTYNDQTIMLSYNSSGYLNWNVTYNFSYSEKDIAVDSNGNILLTDGKNLIKYFSDGNIAWNYSLPDFSFPTTKLAIENNGDILIAESRGIKCIDNLYFLESSCICTAIYLEKIDSSGIQLWEKRCTGCSSNYLSDIALDLNGNIYISGQLTQEFGSFSAVFDAILIKNPKAFGECIEIYYDLIVLIATPITIVGLYLIIRIIRKRKNSEKRQLFKSPTE